MSRRRSPALARGAERDSEALAPIAGAAHLDGGIVAAASLLAGLGIVMVYSATAPLALDAALPPHFTRHLAAVGLGIGIVALCQRLPLSLWRRLALPFWAVSTALVVLTLFAGVRVNAATRWLAVPGLGIVFQPAELAKLAYSQETT